mgnify:CR=1 FL=1
MINNYTYQKFCFILENFCNIDINNPKYIDEFEIGLILSQLYNADEYEFRKKELHKYLIRKKELHKYLSKKTKCIRYHFDFKEYYYGVIDIRKIRNDKLKKIYEEEL